MSVDAISAEALAALPLLPRDEQGPVFVEPWQAQVFGVVVQLNAQGQLTWAEWAQKLGAEFKAAEARGEHATGERYYDYWLDALERLLIDNNLAERELLDAERELIREDDHHRRDAQLHHHPH